MLHAGLARLCDVTRMENRHRSRLLIADDHTLLAEACKSLLEPEFQVVGVVNNGSSHCTEDAFDDVEELG